LAPVLLEEGRQALLFLIERKNDSMLRLFKVCLFLAYFVRHKCLLTEFIKAEPKEHKGKWIKLLGFVFLVFLFSF